MTTPSRLCKTIITYVAEHNGWRKASRDLIILVFELLRQHGFNGLIKSIRNYNFYANQFSITDLNSRPSVHGKAIASLKPLQQHTSTVDIIVCVHNALDDVKRCLESVRANTSQPYSLIIVDDGSKPDTAEYLAVFATTHAAHLIRNEQAKGYTFAANQGLRFSSSDYALLLNSDTIVTPEWLNRMLVCAESDSAIGIVGPLSNTASWQSIPEIEEDGDWAENCLPEGLTISEMACQLAECSAQLYPRLAFLNGFCLMIKRGLIDQLGYFDEEAFGRGYGEENDYCLRARKAGWSLAVADDAYVYHAQSRSYSNERRNQLCELAGKALAEKHGLQIIDEGVRICRHDRILTGIRANSRAMLERWELMASGHRQWSGKKVLFLLPVAEAGGGSNVVIQEAQAMKTMGVDVAILNLEVFRKQFSLSYPEIVDCIPVIYINCEEEIPSVAKSYDAVIATANISVKWMAQCQQKENGPIRGYYIQDFEPHFFTEGSKSHKVAWDSYTLFPDLVRFTKTEWNRNELQKQIGVDSTVIGPSVNIDLFRPRPRSEGNWPERPLRIVAMVRPSSPRRGPKLTMEILREITRQHGSSVEIVLFGCFDDDPAFLVLPHDFPWRNEGKLTRFELAWLFNEIDIFVDFSTFQAMGLTAMEAMACGAAVIVPEAGGSSSFLQHEVNGLMVDATSEKDCITALNRLIRDKELRGRLQRQALQDIVRFHPVKPAWNILKALFGES